MPNTHHMTTHHVLSGSKGDPTVPVPGDHSNIRGAHQRLP
jgi:hypothetical protein